MRVRPLGDPIDVAVRVVVSLCGELIVSQAERVGAILTVVDAVVVDDDALGAGDTVVDDVNEREARRSRVRLDVCVSVLLCVSSLERVSLWCCDVRLGVDDFDTDVVRERLSLILTTIPGVV